MVDGLKRGELTHCMHQAVDQSGVLVVADPAVECGDCPLVGTYAGKAQLIARLEHEGRIYGFITVMVSVGMALDDEEQSLFEELAGDIGFALHNMELEEERKSAEEALRESKERFMALTESTSDWIWEVDENAVYTYASPKVKALLGYEPEEIIGKTPLDLMAPEDAKRVAGEFGAIAEARKPFDRVENENLHKDGRILVLETSGVPIFDANGNFRGYRGIDRDITKRKQAQEERKKLEAQLSQAQKMEAIGVLAGGIAHDFNNILGGVLGFTELVCLDVPEDSLARSNLEEVIKASNRAKGLVKQILTFSRQNGQEHKPLQIQLIVEESLKLLRASLPTTIEIHRNIDINCGAVLANPTQIDQVMMNLCTNAYHAMSDNGGVLKVSLQNSEKPEIKLDPGPYVKLTVSDTGHGMDSALMERIFDPFFTTKEPGQGTGLGLATVHGIVKSHGGAITVHSEQGKGTIFDVYFPRLEKAVALEAPAKEPVPGGKERILFVDDEEQLSRMGQQMLERLGYDVTSRTSSVEALEAFRAQPDRFDVVITDQTMPDMTGMKLAVELMATRSNIPIILTTGFSELVTPEKAMAIGIREYIMKPVVSRDLGKAIRRVLDQKIDG